MTETTRWDAVPREQVSDLIGRRMICGEKVMLVRWEFAKGCYVASHRHPNEQVAVVESGNLRMVIDGKETVLTGGDVRVIPPNTSHDAEAIEDTVVIDIFSPPREDFLGGDGPGYLTRGR